jgi:pimeloyl-ACP methyl ester carboxylesterase
MSRLANSSSNASIVAAVLVAPLSPSGYGGSKGSKEWALAFEDGAGGGAGLVNPDFHESIRRREAGEGMLTARGAVSMLYVSPGGLAKLSKERLDEIVASVLTTRVGDDFWPGEVAASANWPGIKPGTMGINNALAALHTKHLWSLGELSADERVPVTWIRGDKDYIVHNFVPPDLGKSGAAGLGDEYPGAERCPVLSMLDETREVLLNRYGTGDCGRAAGCVKEVVLEGVGHGPVIEAADKVANEIEDLLKL